MFTKGKEQRKFTLREVYFLKSLKFTKIELLTRIGHSRCGGGGDGGGGDCNNCNDVRETAAEIFRHGLFRRFQLRTIQNFGEIHKRSYVPYHLLSLRSIVRSTQLLNPPKIQPSAEGVSSTRLYTRNRWAVQTSIPDMYLKYGNTHVFITVMIIIIISRMATLSKKPKSCCQLNRYRYSSAPH